MLRISSRLYDEVISHCRRQVPKEACGILAGKDGFVSQVYQMTNTERSPISYRMDPREQLRVMKDMRMKNQETVGIYHSHTSSDAYPSAVDASLAISPDISYVLVSLKAIERPIMKAYRISGKDIAEEPISIDI